MKDSFLWKNVLPVNDSMGACPRVRGVAMSWQNDKYFRAAPKDVSSKYMSSNIYNFSTMQKIKMQYELYEGLHESKETEVATL